MIYGYKGEKYLGCSTDAETLEKALKMAGIDTEGMEISDKPPEPPTHEPTKEEKLAQLVAQYEADKAEILKYYADAMIHGDTELMAELAQEITELDKQYATDYKALKEGE